MVAIQVQIPVVAPHNMGSRGSFHYQYSINDWNLTETNVGAIQILAIRPKRNSAQAMT